MPPALVRERLRGRGAQGDGDGRHRRHARGERPGHLPDPGDLSRDRDVGDQGRAAQRAQGAAGRRRGSRCGPGQRDARRAPGGSHGALMPAMTSPMKKSAVLAAALLAGCAIGPDFKRPSTNAPASFRDQAAQGDRSIADLAWWDVCREARLKELVSYALANGYDARIAAARVEESRAIAAQVHGQLFPGLAYVANADRGRNASLGNPAIQSGAISSGFDAYLGAAWEFDLWGRVRRLDEAARSQYLATEDARRGVLLSLVSDVATAYYELLELDDELAIAKEATASFGESLKLFKRRLEGGGVSRLDTASAEAGVGGGSGGGRRPGAPGVNTHIHNKKTQPRALTGPTPAPTARGGRLADLPAQPDVPAG